MPVAGESLNAMTMKTHATVPVAQVNHNTTRWIGHQSMDQKQIATGQTFSIGKSCQLKNIEVYSNLVTRPGEMTMTLHAYDPDQRQWGPVLSKTCVDVDNSYTDKWIPFEMDGTKLSEGQHYGFRIECKNGFVGVGETACSAETPAIVSGQEWEFTSNNEQGCSYSYFSLAFKIGAQP